MNWFEWADEVFAFRPFIAAAICALYAVPLLRLITIPFSIGGRFLAKAVGPTGRWERTVGWIRNWFATPYLIGVAAWNTYRWISTMDEHYWSPFTLIALGSILLIVLGEIYRVWKREGLLALVEFARQYPTVHPAEFFDYYFASLGALRFHLPERPRRQIDPLHVDFRKPNRRISFTTRPFFAGVRIIMTVSHLLLLANKWRNAEYAREVGSSIAVIASSRIAELAQARVNIEGLDNVVGVTEMPFMYCFNHTSALDFLLTPLLLAAHSKTSHLQISLLPCFLMAKDHFLDNPFLYRVLGLGKAAKVLGMVFVERKKRSQTKTEETVSRAAKKLLTGNMPIAIYPQGTRARSKVAPDGSRLDGSYYAVGSIQRLKQEGGHFKKGAAFIAAEAAVQMSASGKEGSVTLVPVAFVGAATALPRKSIKVQRGVDITLRIGSPIEVTAVRPEELNDYALQLNQRIDDALKNTFRIHAELECRFFEEMRNMLDALRLEELSIALKQWRREDYLFYSVLDYIYCCKPKEWRLLLGQLAHFILTDAPREELIAFKHRVADKIPD